MNIFKLFKKIEAKEQPEAPKPYEPSKTISALCELVEQSVYTKGEYSWLHFKRDKLEVKFKPFDSGHVYATIDGVEYATTNTDKQHLYAVCKKRVAEIQEGYILNNQKKE